MSTIKQQIKVQGKGLMDGKDSIVDIFPSEKKGIRFFKNKTEIEAVAENVVSTQNCTVIAKDGASVRLIEHFMAACAFAGIDSLDVCLEADELPILDGSSKIWYQEFLNSGVTQGEKETFSLREPVNFVHRNSVVSVIPADELNISYMVNFNHKDLAQKWVNFNIESLQDEIIEARTFGYLRDLEKIQSMGLAQGVSLENTVGLTDDGYTVALRSEFEPAKHKILDLIGDFMLTGVNPLSLNAIIIAKEAGHFLHVEAAKLMKNSIIQKEKI